MIRTRATLPWLLLAASVALNIHLARNPSSAPAHTPYQSHTSYKSDSDSSAPAKLASPEALSSSPSHSAAPAPLPPSVTLASTASRSAAFQGYADLLAEDVKTAEQIAALNQLLARWVATDPAAAATWLSHYDDAPFYDPAALHVAKHLVAAERFSEASAWADLIRDPALQEDARDAIIAESFRAKKIDASTVRLSGLSASRIAAILNGSRLD